MTDIAMFHLDDDNVVRFSLSNVTRVIDGPEEAVQFVAWAMFTTPGTCLFARQDGGGVLEVIGKNIPEPGQLRADMAISLQKAMATIRRSQSPGRPAKSTVTALDLIDVHGDPSTGVIKLKIRIRLQDGNSFSVGFERPPQ